MIDFDKLEAGYQDSLIDFDSLEAKHLASLGVSGPTDGPTLPELEPYPVPQEQQFEVAQHKTSEEGDPGQYALKAGLALNAGLAEAIRYPSAYIKKFFGVKAENLPIEQVLKDNIEFLTSKIEPKDLPGVSIAWSDEPVEKEIANIGKLRLVGADWDNRKVITEAGKFAGFTAPMVGALKIGKAVTKPLEPFAREGFRRLAGGAIGGALLGEGDPEKTLEMSAIFSLFEAVPVLGKVIKNARTKRRIQKVWENTPDSQKVPVVQSLEETLRKNPNITESELVAKSASYMKQAQERRLKPEQKAGPKKPETKPETKDDIWGTDEEWGIVKDASKESQAKEISKAKAAEKEINKPEEGLLELPLPTPRPPTAETTMMPPARAEQRQLPAPAPQPPKEPQFDFNKMEQGYRVASKEITIPAPDDLLNANTAPERNKMLADAFGLTEKEFKYVQEADAFDPLPEGYKYDLADEYLAELEYAARTRNKNDVEAIIEKVKRGYLPPETIPAPRDATPFTKVPDKAPAKKIAKKEEPLVKEKAVAEGPFGSALPDMIDQLKQGSGKETRTLRDGTVEAMGSSYPEWVRGIQSVGVRKDLGLKSTVKIKEVQTVLEKVREGKRLTARQMTIRKEVERRASKDKNIQEINKYDDIAFAEEPHFDKKTGTMRGEAGEELFDIAGSYKTKEPKEQYSADPSGWELPEIVELAGKIIKRDPSLVARFRKTGTRGSFSYGEKKQFIKLARSLGKDPEKAAEVLAHEIGHAHHYADETMKRGNVLGVIAKLEKYVKKFMAEKPGGLGPLTKEEILSLKKEARDIKEKLVSESIKSEIKIEPETVLDYLRGVDPHGLGKEAVEYIQKADAETKKSIVKQAMKGLSPAELETFGTTVSYKNIKGFSLEKKFQELLRKEVERRKLFDNKIIREELLKHTKKWRDWSEGVDKKYDAYRRSSPELYADAISAMITNPKALKDTAPTFVKAFEKYKSERPEISKTWEDIQARINRGKPEVLKERLQKTFDDFERESEIIAKKHTEDIARRKDEKEGIYDQTIRLFFSKYRPLYKASRTIPNKELREKLNEAIVKRPYTSSEVGQYVYDLEELLVKAEGLGVSKVDMGAVGKYRHIKSHRKDILSSRGETAKTSQDMLDDMRKNVYGPEKFDNIVKMLDEYRALREKWIIPHLEKDLAGGKLLESMKDRKDYLRQSVLKWMEKDPVIGGADGFVKGFHRQEGSFGAVGNPVSATMMDDIAVIYSSRENEFRNIAIDMLTEAGLAKPAPLKKIITGKDSKGKNIVGDGPDKNKIPVGWDLVTSKVAGKTKHTIVPTYLKENIIIEPLTIGSFGEKFSMATQVIKELYVGKNPAWMLGNAPKDFLGTIARLPELRTRDILKLVASYKKVVPEISDYAFKGVRSEHVKDMMRGRSIPVGRVWKTQDLGHGDEIRKISESFNITLHDKKEVAELFKGNLHHKIKEAAKLAWRKADNLGVFSEIVSKAAADDFMKTHTTLPKGKRELRVIGKSGTPNWMFRGQWSPMMNNMFLYSTVAIAGIYSEAEEIIKRPAQYTKKRMATTVMPALVSLAGEEGLLGSGVEAINRRIPQYYKDHYFCIPITIDENGKAVFVSIPIDPIGQMIMATTKNLLRGNFKKARYEVLGGLNPYSPNALISEPLVGLAAANNINPIDMFRKRSVFTKEAMEEGGMIMAKEYGIDAWNSLGLGLLYRFPTRYTSKKTTPLEKITRIKGLGLGAFLRVSDGGIREAVLEELKEGRRGKKEKAMAAKKWLLKFTDKSEKESRKLLRLLENAKGGGKEARQLRRQIAIRYGSAWEKAYYITAKNDEERLTVFKMMQEDKGAMKP